MHEVTARVMERLRPLSLTFQKKPILIGGMAMEYYGMRKAGADIDLVISNEDYQALAAKHPGRRKDIYGDLGLLLNEFEIWRSIALMDYDFFLKDAIGEGEVFVVSIDRLLWMRVCAMEVEKYRKDLCLMKNYYYTHFTNPDYLREARTHDKSYAKMNGTVVGGRYEDA